MDQNKTNEENNYKNFQTNEGWSMRPCFLYKEEYGECTGIKGRFHQYFIHGESIDCSQWKTDYENCVLYEESHNLDAGKAVVESEKLRRSQRLKHHYSNDIWKKRSCPPNDWNKKLPDWLEKKNENTFLELKAKEMSGLIPQTAETASNCSIM